MRLGVKAEHVRQALAYEGGEDEWVLVEALCQVARARAAGGRRWT